jgi:small multidrug resistance family-3 protein
MVIAKSILLFLAAGLFEIGGGYLIWLWLREGKGIWFALAGAITLVLYGIFRPCSPPISAGCTRPTAEYLS